MKAKGGYIERAAFLQRLVGECVRFVVNTGYTSISRDEGHGGIYARVTAGEIVGGVWPNQIYIKLDAPGHRVVPARLADFQWADAPVVFPTMKVLSRGSKLRLDRNSSSGVN